MMKHIVTLSLVLSLFSSSFAFAQSDHTKGMNMKDMDMQKCQEMMKGSNMKDMDMQKCHDMMHGMDNKKQSQSGKTMSHTATGVVKAVDPANGKVTLDHGPVKSLNWPAMTMTFAVKDKMLLDKLTAGKKVKVEFTQEGNDYVVTSVK